MIWNVATSENQRVLRGHVRSVISIAFSENGYLASGSDDKSLEIWDITGKRKVILRDHSDWVRVVAFPADGHYLASESDDKTVKTWDMMGKKRQTFQGHDGLITSITFLADGRYLASGSDDKTVKIWEMITDKEQYTLQGHSHWVWSVPFWADGCYLASGSYDKTIKIWDMTGKEQQTLEIGTEIRTISFDNTTSYLHTEIGLIKLSIEHYNKVQSMTAAQVLSLDPAQGQDQRQLITDNSQKGTRFGWGLSSVKLWITWNEHKIMWLPPECQPSTSAVWPYASRFTSLQVQSTDTAIALGNDSGAAVIINMSGSGPYLVIISTNNTSFSFLNSSQSGVFIRLR